MQRKENVFENTEESRVPSLMIFGVRIEKIYYYKSKFYDRIFLFFISGTHGQSADVTGGETQVSTIYLEDFINSHTVVLTKEAEEEVVKRGRKSRRG
jgi:hypothetical protein